MLGRLYASSLLQRLLLVDHGATQLALELAQTFLVAEIHEVLVILLEIEHICELARILLLIQLL